MASEKITQLVERLKTLEQTRPSVDQVISGLESLQIIDIQQTMSNSTNSTMIGLQILVQQHGIPAEVATLIGEVLEEFSAQQSFPPFLAPPLPPHDLVGRDALLEAIEQRILGSGSQTLVALYGLPGVGKTSLATVLAHSANVLAYFQDGILWAGLGRSPDVLAQLGKWGSALGISADTLAGLNEVATRAQAVKEAISVRKMLLVIDDVWDVETALTFKLGGPHCAHLLTTRLPEVAIRFSAAEPLPVHELDDISGQALLQMLAPSVVEAEPEEAHNLVHVVGALPLALTLMGNYLRVQAHSGQLRRLRKALEQLQQVEARLSLDETQDHPSLPGNKVSLEAVIGVSDAALGEAASKALRALSVFPPKPNSFSEAAALAVCAMPVEVLDTLSDYGLLESAGNERYTMHQVIADYAQTNLTDDTVYQRMALYYADYVEANQDDYETLAGELSNILAAARISYEQGDYAALIRIMYALAVEGYMDVRGHTLPLLERLDEAIVAARQVGDTQKTALHYLLGKRGNAYYQRGELTKAVNCFVEAGELAQELQLTSRYILALCVTAKTYSELGNVADAESKLAYAQQLAEEAGDDGLMMMVLEQRAFHANKLGQYETVRDLSMREVALAERTNDQESRYFGLLNWGIAEQDLGNPTTSLSLLKQALEIAKEADVFIWMANTLYALTEGTYQLGQIEQATAYLEEALMLYERSGYTARAEELRTLRKKMDDQSQAEKGG